jgi:hypothetical protein
MNANPKVKELCKETHLFHLNKELTLLHFFSFVLSRCDRLSQLISSKSLSSIKSLHNSDHQLFEQCGADAAKKGYSPTSIYNLNHGTD